MNYFFSWVVLLTVYYGFYAAITNAFTIGGLIACQALAAFTVYLLARSLR